ncbi:dynein assembly factor 4, axonemal isoform X2 [Selaginella moellendorffii]|uniref:dynein assembly factor 4, axonemal isoform X2 n=1 Tax=Selaginella moellendorffii TaxID=88036 RepID=UPI000D1CE478|nr:dynein assembly factor 4, axonemal isoform X2 [Selaginella moellendorffii]|eukprot:XP_024532692.1 dynein assembly factor 4, axonemal isoform X2 [Selaginella moellendorffii]
MPITPTYSWSETPAWVTVEVFLHSVSQAALDIITTDCYIKVNCSPYLFQADLYDDIDSKKSSAMVDKAVVKFFMFKTEELWGRLTRCGDRQAILERRQQSLDAVRENAQKTKEEAKAKISHIRRLAVGSQMKLEDARRKTIQARKEAELKEERDALNSWQQGVSRENSQHDVETLSAGDSKKGFITCKQEDLMLEWDNVTQASGKIDEANTVQKLEPKRLASAKVATLKPGERLLPAPRRGFRVYISFTKKTLPNHLPARESREKELQLIKHAPISNDAIDVSEREPLFLQDKGDKFYSAGDFRSAVNAYSDAIQKDASLFLSRANRAACYLQMSQMQACINDCTRALQLLSGQDNEIAQDKTEAEQSTAPKLMSLEKDFLPMDTLDLLRAAASDDSEEWKRRAQSCVLARRGCAKGHLGDLEDAVTDFKEALKLNPSATDIRRVLDCIAAK